ncbi:MAG: VOC family protein [Chloroflexota bacterium]|nr:VOC family protein [Chloroflexota bacterium]
MNLDRLDLIVRDVPLATAFFRDVLELALRVTEERFAEIDAGGFTIMLSPEATVPTEPARGIILHFQVDEVAQTLENVRDRGAEVLQEPTRTDWG